MASLASSKPKGQDLADQDGSQRGIRPAIAINMEPAAGSAVAGGVQLPEMSTLFAAVSVPAPVTSQSASLTATATQTKALGTVSSPSWLSKISTASIKADMSAAIANGAVTYSGLLKLVQDLNTTLANSKTTLTSVQFQDLKTIVSNLNNGVTTSAYLTGIMTNLVNGNAANAAWTGGGASSVALGNLAAGANATKLSELIGKWFQGTDLPCSKVYMSGVSPFSVTYSNSSKPVYGTSGPSMNDINQGYLGDCYLLACLEEVAYKNPNTIKSMITSNGNNTYGVCFNVSGKKQYVTVNTALANGGNIFNYGSNIWASLVEKGYAQLQAGGVVTGNTINYGNSWTTIGNGGCPEYALEQITGSSTITDFYAYRGSWTKATYNSSLSLTGYTSGNSTAAIQSILINDLAVGDDLILSSWTNGKDSAGKTTLVAGHAMSIYGFDSKTGMFQIRNPWGSWTSGQYWDTTFEVGLSTLLAAGDTITVDAIGTNKVSASATTSMATTSVRSVNGASTGPYTGDTFGVTAAASSFTHAIAQVNTAPQASAFVNLVRPMQGEQNHLFSPKI